MFYFYLLFTLFFLIYLTFEYVYINKALNRIGIRILVNGTRGKSTMVGLIYQMLTSAGYRVYSKTTGDAPLSLDPDGKTSILTRTGPASIIENVKWLRRISRQTPDAVVLECMALQPENQQVLAKRIFKAHYTVLTNICEDHPEQMGSTISEMSRTIGHCLYPATRLILHRETLEKLQEAEVQLPLHTTVDSGQQHQTFPQNGDLIPVQVIEQCTSLLQCLADHLQIKNPLSASFMVDFKNRLSRKLRISLPARSLVLYDLFSVNDTPSAARLTDRILAKEKTGQIFFLLNTRSDRPLRTREFCRLLGQYPQASAIWLHGTGKRLARRYLQNTGSVLSLTTQSVIDKIHKGFGQSTIVIGLGNRKGTEDFMQYLDAAQNAAKERHQ